MARGIILTVSVKTTAVTGVKMSCDNWWHTPYPKPSPSSPEDPPTPVTPSHYRQHPSGIQAITITEGFSFNLGNVVKYVWRSDHKNGIEDLEKALWYLAREIDRRKAQLKEEGK